MSAALQADSSPSETPGKPLTPPKLYKKQLFPYCSLKFTSTSMKQAYILNTKKSTLTISQSWWLLPVVKRELELYLDGQNL